MTVANFAENEIFRQKVAHVFSGPPFYETGSSDLRPPFNGVPLFLGPAIFVEAT